MPRIAHKQISLTIPSYNIKDVEFLEQVREAHDHNKLSDVSNGVEAAFKKRVEDEFLGQDITPKIRANITEFCNYLLSIAKFYGYNLLAGGLVTALHQDLFSIKTRPVTGMNALLEAIFTYFDHQGMYKLTANGFMRWDWTIAPDDPHSRRLQIMRDNNGTLPGYASDKEFCERYHIHVEMHGQFPLLVLPLK